MAKIDDILEKTKHKPEPESEIPFKFECRICGSNEYENVNGNTSFVPMGGRIHPIAYRCKGCSVLFGDPETFSINKKIITRTSLTSKDWKALDDTSAERATEEAKQFNG